MTGLPNIRWLHQKLYNVAALERTLANARRLYMDLRDQEERRYYAGMSMRPTVDTSFHPMVIEQDPLVFIGIHRPRHGLPFAILQRGLSELHADLEQLRTYGRSVMLHDDQAAVEQAIEMLEALG
jgi:hypothetical protein